MFIQKVLFQHMYSNYTKRMP